MAATGRGARRQGVDQPNADLLERQLHEDPEEIIRRARAARRAAAAQHINTQAIQTILAAANAAPSVNQEQRPDDVPEPTVPPQRQPTPDLPGRIAPDAGRDDIADAGYIARLWYQKAKDDPNPDHTDDLDHLQVERLARVPLDYEGSRWLKGATLGSGAFGIAYSFFLRDAHGNHADTIAVKDAAILSASRRQVDFWYPDIRDPERQPTEIVATTRLSDTQREAPRKPCVELRHSEFFDNLHLYRLYMDYYAAGSLYSALMRHWKQEVVVPESAIWAILDVLTDACIYLAHGSLHAHPDDSWTSIVHRDIKFDNIFLKTLSPEDEQQLDPPFPAVLQAILADFGGAVMLENDETLNPLGYLGVGTQGWEPPECLGLYRVRNLMSVDWKLSEKSNICGIGLVAIRAMMITEQEPSDDPMVQLDIDPLEFENEQIFPASEDAQRRYSRVLINLVHRCTLRDPTERIELTELRAEIDSFINGPPNAADGAGLTPGDRAARARVRQARATDTGDTLLTKPFSIQHQFAQAVQANLPAIS